MQEEQGKRVFGPVPPPVEAYALCRYMPDMQRTGGTQPTALLPM